VKTILRESSYLIFIQFKFFKFIYFYWSVLMPFDIEVDLPINACEHSNEVKTISLSQKLML
jgi:hypothetical protein